VENWKKWLSEGSDEWKTGENGFPRPRRAKECRKTLVVGRRNAKNAKKRLSSADEMRKTLKNARRRSTKRKKREKGPVVGRRNAENAEKQFFVPLRRAKNAENRVS